jgi:uncharacterized membrane protein
MIEHLIDLVAQGIEVLAVLTIVVGMVYGVWRYGRWRYFFYHKELGSDAYKQLKNQVGRSLLLGLEFLVAADIIKTVALRPTLLNVAILGILVVIRTFLSWSLVVEIEGKWPWQTKKSVEGRGSSED